MPITPASPIVLTPEQFTHYARLCPALSSLSEAAVNRLSQSFRAYRVPERAMVFCQGDASGALFVLAEGSVDLFMPWGDEDLLMVTEAPGDMFGESEYFEQSPRSTSARTSSESILLELSYRELPLLFNAIPELYSSFMAQRLSETSRRFRQSLQRSRVAERSLQQINEFFELSDPSSLDEGSEGLIRRIVHMASKVMKADRASLFLVDPETGELWSLVAQGEGSRKIVIPPGKGIAGWCFENDEMYVSADVYEDPKFNRETDLETGYRTKSMLCGPVKNPKGRCVGIIQVINKLSGEFNEEDVSLFRAFAHQSAVAVDNFMLFNKLRLSNQRMAVMLDVLDAVTSTNNMAALIGRVIEKTITVMQCERASFFVLDRRKNELWSLKATGDGLHELRFPADIGIAGACALKSEVIRVEDAYADERFNPMIDRRTGFRTRNILAVPVHDREGNVTAVVEAINRIGGGFDDEDEMMLKAIASQISEALKKASLLDELKRSNVELTSSNLSLDQEVAESMKALQEANHQLELANLEMKHLINRKSEFLGIAAHDLRNPLANIFSVAEVLSENCAARSSNGEASPVLEIGQEREFIGMILYSVGTMLKTLEDLMNTESLDAGAPQLHLETIDIVDTVRRIIELNRPNASRKSIHISITEDGQPLQVNADPSRLREIFDNLISNAIKYSPPGKRVWVSILKLQSSKEDRVRIAIKDEGPGMQASDLKEVFGKFKKLSARPTAGEASSGLGLYIAKKLVTLHKGNIWVESVYGHGATFFVEFPTVLPKAASHG